MHYILIYKYYCKVKMKMKMKENEKKENEKKDLTIPPVSSRDPPHEGTGLGWVLGCSPVHRCPGVCVMLPISTPRAVAHSGGWGCCGVDGLPHLAAISIGITPNLLSTLRAGTCSGVPSHVFVSSRRL